MAMINNANDVLFDLCTRLKDNGVVAKVSGDYEFSEDNISLDFVERISELDFSEHDKRFKDEIRQLKHELEEKRRFETDRFVKLPFDALETANMLINATYRRKANGIDRLRGCAEDTIETDMYSIDDLEQIAEHLLVYCKHNKEE